MADNQPPQVLPIGPGDPVNRRRDLIVGRLIVRWSEPYGRMVRAPLPCCGDEPYHQKIDADPGRSLTGVAVCRRCGESYELALVPDSDSWFWAHFTVAYHPFLLSSQRTAGKTRQRGAQRAGGASQPHPGIRPDPGRAG